MKSMPWVSALLIVAAIVFTGCGGGNTSFSSGTDTGAGTAGATGVLGEANNMNDWMSSLDDKTPLTDLSIPGTHDTCAHYGGKAVECQNGAFSVANQLKQGIRYLDIRCRHYENAFAIHHGSFYQHLNFDDVLSACTSFLKENPKETVLMQVKEEYNSYNCTRSFGETFRTYRDKTEQYWYNGYDIPTLGQARGKIILIKRFDDTSIPGLDLAGKWVDNGWSTTDTAKIQDNYKVYYDNTNISFNPRSKFWFVVIMINESAFLWNNRDSRLYINYASGSTGMFPSDVANGKYPFLGVNRNLYNYLTTCHHYRTRGVIAMDFPDDTSGLISEIIKLNSCETWQTPEGLITQEGRYVKIFPAGPEGSDPSDLTCSWEVQDGGTSEGDKVQLWDTDRTRAAWSIKKHPGSQCIYFTNKDSENSYRAGGVSEHLEWGVKCGLAQPTSPTTLFYATTVKNSPGRFIFWSYNDSGLPLEYESGNLGRSTKVQFWSSLSIDGLYRVQWTLKDF
ncbi:MAG: phosphatidylinositol-specific phospholipase C [Candidatus Xenobiia bacterium LiM19]